MNSIKELNEEELDKITGGVNTEEQGPKYKEGTYVKFVGIGGMLIIGRIDFVEWDQNYNQYFYHIYHDEVRFLEIDTKEVKYLEANTEGILECDIKYEL